MSRYRIPKGRIRRAIEIKGSRFIATLAPAFSVKEARAFIQSLREEMPDATHHVYAFIVGYGASVSEGMSDDGEPSGTSGPPALAILRGAGVGDVALVITRYFGGTKLGTGGLVEAYGAAAKEAVAAMETVEKINRVPVKFSTPYALHKKVRQLIEQKEGIIESEEFQADVLLLCQIPEETVEVFSQELLGLSGGKIKIERMLDRS